MFLMTMHGIVNQNVKMIKIYPERLSGIINIGDNDVLIHDMSHFPDVENFQGKEVIAKVNPYHLIVSSEDGRQTVLFALESISTY